MLHQDYGNTSVKEKYINSNQTHLDSNDLALLNAETLKYRKQTTEGTLFITTLFTFAALIYGIIALPARRSPLRHTVAGLGLGLVTSYGFWRVQLYRFDANINMLFRKVVRDQYELLH